MEPVEPDLSLLESTRWGIVPKLLIAFLCIFGAAMLYFSPPRVPRKLPPERPRPAAPAPQLYVTLAPPAPKAPASEGWCCVDAKGSPLKLSAMSRTSCASTRGVFFEEEDQAKLFCSRQQATCVPPGYLLFCTCDELDGTRMTLLESWTHCGPGGPRKVPKAPSGSPRGQGKGA
jgi:hypothetical protein